MTIRFYIAAFYGLVALGTALASDISMRAAAPEFYALTVERPVTVRLRDYDVEFTGHHEDDDLPSYMTSGLEADDA